MTRHGMWGSMVAGGIPEAAHDKTKGDATKQVKEGLR